MNGILDHREEEINVGSVPRKRPEGLYFPVVAPEDAAAELTMGIVCVKRLLINCGECGNYRIR